MSTFRDSLKDRGTGSLDVDVMPVASVPMGKLSGADGEGILHNSTGGQEEYL